MTGTQTQGFDRNIEAATRFLDRVAALPVADRERIANDSFGRAGHTSAIMMVADEVTSVKNKDRQGRISRGCSQHRRVHRACIEVLIH